MWLKKCTCFLLACVAVFGCLFTPVAAAELGEQKVEIEERRATGKFDFDIPAKTLMKASSSFPMEYGETVTKMEMGAGIQWCYGKRCWRRHIPWIFAWKRLDI